MQVKRRWISFLSVMLMLLLLVPFTVSCQNDTAESVETDSEKIEEETVAERKYLDDLGEFDFGGREFKVLSVTATTGTYTTFDVDDYSGTMVDQSIYDRNREIEERFNVVFESDTESYGKCYTVCQQEALAPTENYDLIMLINRNACTALLSKWILLPSQIPHLDMSKDYYMQDINEMCTVNGVQ